MGPAYSRRIPRVPRYSGAASAPLRVSPTGLSPPMVTLSCVFGYPLRRLCRRSYNPGRCRRQPRFGLLRVRSPLLAQSLLFSLPAGTEMFQFPAFALRQLPQCRDLSRRVSPFGHPRVTRHLPLTAAFRSLSRPSSPPRATGIPRAPFLAFSFPFRLQNRDPLACVCRALRASSVVVARFSLFASSADP